jgi:hypothetical protein
MDEGRKEGELEGVKGKVKIRQGREEVIQVIQ